MKTYRITVLVTTDVNAEDEASAIQAVTAEVRRRIGDDGTVHRDMWFNGIGRDARGLLIFPREISSQSTTVAESQ